MKHLWLLMAIAATAMCAPFATAQTSPPKSGACWQPMPVKCGNGEGTCCGCTLLLDSDGFCTCAPGGDGSTCTESGSCNESPDSCGKAGPISGEQLAFVQRTVSAHVGVVPVFIAKECYDGALGKAFVDEATRQEKAIRFFLRPENLTPETLATYNRHIAEIQEQMARMERSLKANP
jgi:hypothetical protein